MRLSSIAGAAFFLALLAATLNAREIPDGFSGEWKTTFGPIRLKRNGADVNGQIVAFKLPLKGKIDGKKLVVGYDEGNVHVDATLELVLSLVDRRVVFNPDEFKYDPNDKWGKWNYGPNPLWISHLALELCLSSGEVKLPSPAEIFGHWSKQGVFWINRTLTYTKWETDVGQPGHRRSHQKVWAPFTRSPY